MMLDILRPVLGPIEWPSRESSRQKAKYEAEKRKQLPASLPEPGIQIHELLASASGADDRVFESICQFLLGDSAPVQRRDDELLPQWSRLATDLQKRVVNAAATYLNGECPVKDRSWIHFGGLPRQVLYGFWALRLLSVKASAKFASISGEVWWDWMPCVFGDPYSGGAVDECHEAVIKAAYRSAPNRFPN
jgi:hypothetical protein